MTDIQRVTWTAFAVLVMFFLNLYLSYDPIEVSVCWPVHLKIPLADLVDGLDIGQMDIAHRPLSSSKRLEIL